MRAPGRAPESGSGSPHSKSGKRGHRAVAVRVKANQRIQNCRKAENVHVVAMKTTLSVSSRGLITLPAKFRKAAGIRLSDSLIAETTGEGILLRPAVTLPVEIYTEARTAEFDRSEAELAAVLGKTKPRRR